MLKSERKQIILSQLKQDCFVTLENLTVLLSDTSESTIRRDLDELAADGQLKRVHGGAESIRYTSTLKNLIYFIIIGLRWQ